MLKVSGAGAAEEQRGLPLPAELQENLIWEPLWEGRGEAVVLSMGQRSLEGFFLLPFFKNCWNLFQMEGFFVICFVFRGEEDKLFV